MKNVAVIILNWNGGDDTITCLQSLLPHLQKDDCVFIIDNKSTDDSVNKIFNYLESNHIDFTNATSTNLVTQFSKDTSVCFIQNAENLGFGAGCNVVIKQLNQLDSSFKSVWLLNNDAIVEENTLAELKSKMDGNPKLGAVGSIVLNYPDNGNLTIQNTGVKYYPLLGVGKLVNKNKKLSSIDFTKNIKFDYINGASLMLKVSALDEIGGFDEQFFMYFEELDLQLRLKEANYELTIVPESKVYHKLMGSTQSKPYLFFYYYNKTSIQLMKKHYPFYFVFIVPINLSLILLKRTFPSFKNFSWGMKGIFQGIFNK